MNRILPQRLKSTTSSSRIESPLKGNKDNMSSPTKDNGLALKVVVMKGRNLAAKDRGGTSDPYLVLSLGEAKIQTHSVPKSLNPEWNVVEEMPVNSVQSLLLDVICWDKDRFKKDYMGEFDVALEDIFANGRTSQEPKWYPLRSKRPGKKTSVVSGEVQLQFTLFDSSSPGSSAQHVFDKFNALVKSLPEGTSRTVTPTMTPLQAPARSPILGATSAPRTDGGVGTPEDEDEDDYFELDEPGDEPEDPSKPEETIERRRRRMRVKSLRRKRKQNPYEFLNGGSDVVGIIFLEIVNITDLPPESNFTKTSFDMDPFVVASLGKKTYRTRRIRHNLNPVFNEKMVFQVQSHEQQYSFAFTVIDHDKYSGNDFIASCYLSLKDLIDKAPSADPETGLYELREPAEYGNGSGGNGQRKPRSGFRNKLALSRSSSTSSLSKLMRPPMAKQASAASVSTAAVTAAATATASTSAEVTAPALTPGLLNSGDALAAAGADAADTAGGGVDADDGDFHDYSVPLKMKNLDKWEAKHNPVIYLRAKYMPYPALRQQFWRAMLKQYDTDESGRISKVELTTMLDTLGSTLRESTIDSFFQRFPHKINGSEEQDLTVDEVVICLEDQLEAKSKPLTLADRVKGMLPDVDKVKNMLPPAVAAATEGNKSSQASDIGSLSSTTQTQQPPTSQATSLPPSQTSTSTIHVPELNTPGEEGEFLRDDLAMDDQERGGEEHVVEIRECPICHQPRLNKRKDADIITHIATCASQDWRQVNTLMMGGFVTASQAQRKWYSKVITKISYGGYKLGANSANILVQDRITGQINEEKMSVYVRLGIRLLYKGLKANNMEKKRIRKLLKSMSIKQGKKYDDPASRSQIEPFIDFHRLDMSEVLMPVDQFKSFNEFFYRALKPDARPCSAPDNAKIVVSPADCRSVVFNRVDQATAIWIKGREFSVRRLLGDAYGDDAPRYERGGALGIFRLAPQDYHRFHIPVDGTLLEPKLIAGEYYTVNPMAIRSALDVYGENVRVVCPIDSEEHGRVMVVCVGAMMVGSTVITRKAGEKVHRAEELGYFKFGGSTIVVLFEEGKMVFDDDLVDNSNTALETLIRAGMSIGHSPDEPQWTWDMRKDEKDITEADKRDAKRRIQGTISAPDSPENSGDDKPRSQQQPQPTTERARSPGLLTPHGSS